MILELVITPKTDIKKVEDIYFGELKENLGAADIKLCTRNTSFSVHRNIIAAQSPVFAQLLSNQSNKDSVLNVVCHSIIEESDEEIAQMKALEEKPQEIAVTCKDRNTPESKNDNLIEELHIDNLQPETLKDLLYFIYTQNLENVNLKSPDLLVASIQYKVL